MVSCSSCGRKTESYAKIICPSCSAELFRCSKCRSGDNRYACKCGFSGP